MSKTFLFQAIQFTQTIHFSMRMLLVLFNQKIGPWSGATTPGQSGPGSDGNEGVLRIPQSSSIVGTSPSDCLVSKSGHSLGGGGGLTPLQISSRCILQPQLTGQLVPRSQTCFKLCFKVHIVQVLALTSLKPHPEVLQHLPRC